MAGAVKGSSQHGFTLVELMVTLVMTALLVGAMYILFGDQEKIYATEEQTVQMQQNARAAMEMISRDVRMAGFFGCGSTSGTSFTDTVNGHTTDFLLNLGAVDGLDNVTGSAGSSGNPLGAMDGSDVLAISYADAEHPYTVDVPYMNTDSADIHLATGSGLVEGDIVVVSDCSHTSVFQITGLTASGSGRSVTHNTGNSNPGPGNATKDLGYEFGGGAQLYEMVQKYYWLTPQGDLEVAQGTCVNGTWNPTNQEVTVAENIQNLQFEYGVDTNGDGSPDEWQNAAQVTNWDQVVAVRIYILARTARKEKNYINRNSYTFTDSSGTVTLGPYNDAYHRYFLTRSVAIRNRWSD